MDELKIGDSVVLGRGIIIETATWVLDRPIMTVIGIDAIDKKRYCGWFDKNFVYCQIALHPEALQKVSPPKKGVR